MIETKSEAEKLLEKANSDSASDLIILKEDLVKKYSAELVDFLMDESRRYKDFGMSSKVLQQLIDLKKAYWPAAQTNKNYNVDVFDSQLKTWIETTMQMPGITKTQIKNEIEQQFEQQLENDR
jgi:hypothetical protein